MKRTIQTIDPRTNRSKSALRDAMLKLMDIKQYDSITISELIECAGYNRSTFYANYGTKQDLLEDMINMQVQELVQSFRAPYMNETEFFPHELSAHSVLIFDTLYRNASFYTIIMKNNLLPLLWQKILHSLKQTLKEELLYEDGPVDHELAITYSLHALLGLLFHWIETGFAKSPSYMQEQLVGIISYHSGENNRVIKIREMSISR